LRLALFFNKLARIKEQISCFYQEQYSYFKNKKTNVEKQGKKAIFPLYSLLFALCSFAFFS